MLLIIKNSIHSDTKKGEMANKGNHMRLEGQLKQ